MKTKLAMARMALSNLKDCSRKLNLKLESREDIKGDTTIELIYSVESLLGRNGSAP